jgi:hypothetical protein
LTGWLRPTAPLWCPASDPSIRERDSAHPNLAPDLLEGRARRLRPMNDVTRILAEIGQGDRGAAGRLLPLVYDELRRLAAQKLAREAPGQTLQATALVHEAYLRLVGHDPDRG